MNKRETAGPEIITVYFGVFGERDYSEYELRDGVALIACRWCVDDGKPNLNCRACKNTRRMWAGID